MPTPGAYVKVAAGSLGGVMEACCLQPVDVVKMRLQLDSTGAYWGIAHCATTVARAEGVRVLWKGLTPFATHLTLKYALRLGSNVVPQSVLKDPTAGKVSAQGRIASGFGAGVIEALLIVTPFKEWRLVCVSCFGPDQDGPHRQRRKGQKAPMEKRSGIPMKGLVYPSAEGGLPVLRCRGRVDRAAVGGVRIARTATGRNF